MQKDVEKKTVGKKRKRDEKRQSLWSILFPEWKKNIIRSVADENDYVIYMPETNVLYYFITFRWFQRTNHIIFFLWFCIHEFMTIHILAQFPSSEHITNTNTCMQYAAIEIRTWRRMRERKRECAKRVRRAYATSKLQWPMTDENGKLHFSDLS